MNLNCDDRYIDSYNIEEVGVSNLESVVHRDVEVLSTNSIVDQLGSRLFVGEVVKSVEDAYKLYCNNAHAKGFSVKKSDQLYFPGTNELQAQEFECSCECSKDEKRSNAQIPVYLKPTSRNETESSFEWLFKTFLDSMNGKQPETIFTDQCQAMMNAIETIFLHSHHWLCQWHINQNAPSHLGSLNDDSSFKRLWNKCMTHCESEEEFESTWSIMIDEYNLSGHKWLHGVYTLRYKWATAFSNHKFSAGLLATSRSEVTNDVLKRSTNSAISLYDFVVNYEKIQQSWREKEKAEDTRCHHKKSPTMLKNNPMLNSAADVYTLTVYKLFALEFINSLNMRFIEMPLDFSAVSLDFKVKSHDENSRVRHVIFNKETIEVKCICQKFESMGILCKHILMVFNFMNVNYIPKPYLKKR
ncbi:protein FAR1-RELATED SEQUENCE 5-like [Primulina tabacum]|uniref:protein FAR1-RELATED SEQUENCE 5-like n=1 Tax=Primulina tabacum TaxID=48773 RepID=UPI003F5AC414